MDMAKLLCAFAGVTDPVKLHEAIRSGDPVAGRGAAPRARPDHQRVGQ
jgi:hypothetical protein